MTHPDLALIHGWGLGRSIWNPCRDALEKHARLHLIDLPGYGNTSDNGESFELAAQSMINRLPAGVTLCGWSLGGLFALQAARHAPERVGRLILIGGTPSFMQHDDWSHLGEALLAGRVSLSEFAAAASAKETGAAKMKDAGISGDALRSQVSDLISKGLDIARDAAKSATDAASRK